MVGSVSIVQPHHHRHEPHQVRPYAVYC
uniref:Uncharacterized protein n=1 Tax=Arundo donax TaxID=35708 RepID=A0A0A9EAA5_ARUDO